MFQGGEDMLTRKDDVIPIHRLQRLSVHFRRSRINRERASGGDQHKRRKGKKKRQHLCRGDRYFRRGRGTDYTSGALEKGVWGRRGGKKGLAGIVVLGGVKGWVLRLALGAPASSVCLGENRRGEIKKFFFRRRPH